MLARGVFINGSEMRVFNPLLSWTARMKRVD